MYPTATMFHYVLFGYCGLYTLRPSLILYNTLEYPPITTDKVTLRRSKPEDINHTVHVYNVYSSNHTHDISTRCLIYFVLMAGRGYLPIA